MKLLSISKLTGLILFLLSLMRGAAGAEATTNVVTGITVTSSTHQFLADRSGSVTLTVSVAYKGTISRLGVHLVAPVSTGPKWSFASAVGPTAQPLAGDTTTWDFSYTTTPASPVTFSVTLNYAPNLATPSDGVTSLQSFTAQALLDRAIATDTSGTPIQTTVSLAEAVFHTTDTNQDMRIDLADFLKVLQIYNTRNGTVRSGAYDSTTYAPAPNAAPVTPAPSARHSADIDGDGTISLMELLRVMDLCMYAATPAGRTGEYHADSQGIDKFSPAP